MRVEGILVTEPDMLKLADLLEEGSRWPGLDREHSAALRRTLDHARVIGAEEIDPDVVTLHSRVRVKGLDQDGDGTYTLLMPAQAWTAAGMISVLSPMGSALLGRRPGDEIEWRVSGGLRRVRVEDLFYQPEAAAHRSAQLGGWEISDNGCHRQQRTAGIGEERK
jgi:regulator of nucleoside diphosphate kinase